MAMLRGAAHNIKLVSVSAARAYLNSALADKL
uniref:Uncharacterized protein n=1 Tax=Anguilla anguilla TaxID=7936 RepID=A0A0E9S3P5_ANGAN